MSGWKQSGAVNGEAEVVDDSVRDLGPMLMSDLSQFSLREFDYG